MKKQGFALYPFAIAGHLSSLIINGDILRYSNRITLNYNISGLAGMIIPPTSEIKAVFKITDELYKSAWTVYQSRMDKDWGITDCTSFEVMQTLDIKVAFTNDKDFGQAGYSLYPI